MCQCPVKNPPESAETVNDIITGRNKDSAMMGPLLPVNANPMGLLLTNKQLSLEGQINQ
jgi:hypothetical protein